MAARRGYHALDHANHRRGETPSLRSVTPPAAFDRFVQALPKMELHCHLLGTVRGGVGVLGAGEAQRLMARILEEAPAGRSERPGVQAVERLVALRRADAFPDCVER